jgi:hypothetical protein
MEWTIDAIWKKDMVPCYNRDGEVARVALGVGRSGERGEVTLHMPETHSIVIHDHTTRARTIIISTYELVPEDSIVCYLMILLIILYLKTLEMIMNALGLARTRRKARRSPKQRLMLNSTWIRLP